MAKAHETANTEVHQFNIIGASKRNGTLATLRVMNTGTAKGRKSTNLRLGDTCWFTIDPEAGWHTRDSLVEACVKDEDIIELWGDTAEAHGWDRDEAIAFLKAQGAKRVTSVVAPTLSEHKARKAAAAAEAAKEA